MNMFTSPTLSSSLQAFGLTLFHSLWQGMIVGLLCWFLLRLLPQRAASLRFIVAYTCLLALFAAFAITFYQQYTTLSSELQSGYRHSLSATEVPLFLKETPSEVQEGWWTKAQGLYRQMVITLRFYAPYIVVGWMLGFLYFAMQLCTGLYHLRLLKQKSYQPAARWLHTLHQLQLKLNIHRKIRLLVASRADAPGASAPFTSGWLKPVILLPSGIFTELSPEELETIILHELAHIKRHDYLFNLIQSVIEVSLFFNPAYWYLSAIIEQEREKACDKITLDTLQHPLPYARALTRLAEISQKISSDVAIAATGKNYLQQRIYNIMRHSSSPLSRSRTAAFKWYQLTIIAIFGLLFLIMAMDVQGNKTVSDSSNLNINPLHQQQKDHNILKSEPNQKMLHKSARISGSVIDAETGEPLEGVSVGILHQSNNTQTQSEGRFAIQANLSIDTVVFSAPGYQRIKTPTGFTQLNIALQKAAYDPLKPLQNLASNHILYVINQRSALVGNKGTLNTLLYDLEPEEINSIEIVQGTDREKLIKKFTSSKDNTHITDVVLIRSQEGLQQEGSSKTKSDGVQRNKKVNKVAPNLEARDQNNDDSTLYIIDGIIYETSAVPNELSPHSFHMEVTTDKGKLSHLLSPQQLAEHKKFVIITTDDHDSVIAHEEKSTLISRALYIVDGKISSESVAAKIKSSDIDLLSVFKDSLATAKYGDKGKNGVIVITTKKGAVTAAKDKDTDAIVVYPNPLTDNILSIRFNLQQPQKVQIEILNEQGTIIGKLSEGKREAGEQELQWQKGNQPAGIYTVKITKGGKVLTRKVVIQ